MISVQFIGFDSENTLVEAIGMVLRQRGTGGIELNLCDPNNCFDYSAIEKELQIAGFQAPVKQANRANDDWGILNAKGDYIALCCAGDVWCDGDKLSEQVRTIRETQGCTLVTHDVELLKEDGYPCDQTVRNRYMEQLGYQDRWYGMEQFQRFESPGLMGTWVFPNLFRDEQSSKIYNDSRLDPKLRVLGMLMCRGTCVNLFDKRFLSCQRDEEYYRQQYFPKYGPAELEEKKAELEEVRRLLSCYGIEMDTRYRLIHIANGVFNAFSEAPPTKESVALFMQAYQDAYREEYDTKSASVREKAFFNYVRKKVRHYEIKKGTEITLPLAVSFKLESNQARVRLLNQRQVSRSLKEEILQQAVNPEAVSQAAKKQRNLWGRFVAKVKNRVWRIYRAIKKVIKRAALRRLRKRGFSSYMANEWFETVYKNLLHDKETPIKRKLWCYRRGFMPWRIEQYGLTEENYQQFLSDRDYMYLHQINNSYKKWIEDKMTLRYVLEPFKQHLPKYYFQIIQRDDRQLIVKLQDCPEGYEATLDELFRLLREKGALAFKAASGTHGVGFFKVEYRDGTYYLNNSPTSEHSLRGRIKKFKSFYIVTEYVNMHDEIKALYPGSVNTIRVMMLNRDGHHPQIMDAYMRIGSAKSGVTDNVAYGGIVCSIDVDSGEYREGLRIVNHVFVSTECHPDTEAELHGIIPNWAAIKQGLVDISQHMPQLEYLGFDVVCTPEGFIILEINSHQDLHRYRYLDQRIKNFYFYKLRRKQRRYKIGRN